MRRASSGGLADVHAKSRRAASSGVCMSGICRMSPGRSPVDWKESRKENLHVDDEGKLLLRCAERDARRASSGISRGEMREKPRFVGNVDLMRKLPPLEVGGHTEPRVGMKNCLAYGEVRRLADGQAPCRC